MAETVQSFKIEVRLSGMIAGDNGAAQHVDKTYAFNFADGTGDAQIGSIYKATRTLVSTNEDLDISGGAIKDFQGVALAMTKMKALLVVNNGTAAGNDVAVKQPSSNGVPFAVAAGDGLNIGPGGLLLLISPNDGYTVTAGTGDLVNVATDFSGTYDVLVAGTNA